MQNTRYRVPEKYNHTPWILVPLFHQTWTKTVLVGSSAVLLLFHTAVLPFLLTLKISVFLLPLVVCYGSLSGNHKCLHQILRQPIQEFARYFTHDHKCQSAGRATAKVNRTHPLGSLIVCIKCQVWTKVTDITTEPSLWCLLGDDGKLDLRVLFKDSSVHSTHI